MSLWQKSFNSNIKVTPEGGIAVKMINKTGANSIKGSVLSNSPDTEKGVVLIPIGEADPIGIMLNDGVPDGLPCWVVVAGKAQVYFIGNVQYEYICRVTASDDVGAANGRAIAEPMPVPPFATDKHFQEIGHALQARTGAGLALVNLHFN